MNNIALLMLKTIAVIFLLLIPINFIGFVECENWKRDEKHWLFSLIMSVMGFCITAIATF